MNDEIQFGEVEHAAPHRALRPDENRHYAVAAYGEPEDGDLAIFIDLDVLADMEDHALSNTAVELGGVLLGGCYEDEQGRPFVVISDSLRAQHYESTKGSFKFTHDTWAAITRERDAFPAELAMVGWYHTHPDWGVFLSGMDMFICDNFFNKKLDVAYVIDPCRGDRGMFQWTRDARHRVRRTGGFFVTASRFRAAELEYYVAELSSTMPAVSSLRSAAASTAAPIVHLHQPRDSQPPWQGLAIAGALALQLLLVALIAWRVLVPEQAGDQANNDKMVAALEKLDASLGSLDARRKAELAEERAQARMQFLDEAFHDLKGTDKGAISRLQEKFDLSEQRKADLAARDAQIREMHGFIKQASEKIDELEVAAKLEEARLKSRIDDLHEKNDRLKTDFKKTQEEVVSLSEQLKSEKAASEKRGGAGKSVATMWWWVGGGALAAVVLLAGVWWFGGRTDLPPAAPDTALASDKIEPGPPSGA